MLPNLLLGYTFYDKAVSVQAFLAFHAGVFRGARLSSLPIFDWCNKFKQNTNADPCLSKNAWFLDHYMNLCHPWWTHFDQYLKVFKICRVIYGFLFGFCMEYLLKLKGLSIFTVFFCSLQYYYCCNKLLVFMCFFSMNNNILLQLGLGVASPQRSFGVRLSRIHFSPTEKCPWGRHEYATNEPQRTSAWRQGLGVDVQKRPSSFGLFAA